MNEHYQLSMCSLLYTNQVKFVTWYKELFSNSCNLLVCKHLQKALLNLFKIILQKFWPGYWNTKIIIFIIIDS